MKKQLHKHASSTTVITILAGFLVVMLGLVLSVAVQPAQASPLPQAATATVTLTPAGSATVAATTGAGTLTVTATATQSGTLAAPVATGTSSALVPVTGADLTNQGGWGSNVGIWLAVWLVGLLLVGFGLRARLSKRP